MLIHKLIFNEKEEITIESNKSSEFKIQSICYLNNREDSSSKKSDSALGKKDDPASTSDALSRLLESAKSDIKGQLKRPQDLQSRVPLSHVNQ